MKYSILIQILFLLLAREKVSAKYIAEKFDISLRTVYRYIDELSLCVPLYNTRGRNGGYSISDTYKIPASFFTKEETGLLISTLTSVKDSVNSKNLESIINKLLCIIKKSDDLHIDFGNLVIDGGPWGNTEGYKDRIALIEKCIEEKKKVYIAYQSRHGEVTDRIIEPHTLVLKEGLWYCYAYCSMRNEFRLFKLGRIIKAEIKTETFTRHHIENITERLKQWYETLESQDIDLLLSKKVKEDVEEWLGVDKVYTTKNEIRASVSMPISNVLIGKILSFGSEVKVLAPIELQKLVLSRAEEIIKNYK